MDFVFDYFISLNYYSCLFNKLKNFLKIPWKRISYFKEQLSNK